MRNRLPLDIEPEDWTTEFLELLPTTPVDVSVSPDPLPGQKQVEAPWENTAMLGDALVLIACRDPLAQAELNRMLAPCRLRTTLCGSVKEMMSILNGEPYSMVICGTQLEDGNFCEILRRLRQTHPGLPVVIASGPSRNDEFRDFLNALHFGAFDFVCYPYRKLELEQIVRSALRETSMRKNSRPV